MFDALRDMHVYRTSRGVQVCADSREVLRMLPAESVDLILTSPPFALLREKSYGNKGQEDYVSWLHTFGQESLRVLKPQGSFVLDLGGAYKRGKPVRSLYNFRILLDFCDTMGYRLAEEFFWYNPAKLPSPIEWVNKRKIRVKDAVNTIWWFAKSDNPKADVSNVLVPYSERMKTLLRDPEKFYRPKQRPSGHDVGRAFGRRNNGAIPSNLLQAPNTESNSHYLRMCKLLGRGSHPARFPADIPKFFIRLLTEPGDLVVDIFSGSNTTGCVADRLKRSWLSIEINREYAVLSAVRFTEGWDAGSVRALIRELDAGTVVELEPSGTTIRGERVRARRCPDHELLFPGL